MKALLKGYRQSPRKVRILADLVRGKNAERAMSELSFTTKKSALTIKKLIGSAVANSGLPARDLLISKITVDEGPTLKRSMPRSRGMANPIRKRTSHINILLSEGTTSTK